MPNKLDYTSTARKFAYRFPRWSYISIQINFWILAFFLYSTITFINSAYLNEFSPIAFPLSYPLVVLNSVILGVSFGIILGITDLLIDRTVIRRLSVGGIILLRVIAYPVVLFCVLLLVRYVFADWINSIFDFEYTELINSNTTWWYLFWSLLIYTAFMAAVVTFINQMNLKFGPGVLIPLLLGKYRSPKEQTMFFMFIDLKDSTGHAEKLGHLKYSAMIRDCFTDLNDVLTQNNAEIYQYVGDESVITWPKKKV